MYAINVLAPLALIQLALPLMPAGACVVNVTSDAAVEPYEGWGGYGSSKAALEQLSAILAAERPQLRVYAVDPGDMRTRMHQEAFPGEDISDRPLPETSVPGLLELIGSSLPSGRYQARELRAGGGSGDERAGVRAAPARWRPRRRRRPGGSTVTACGCWWPTSADGAIIHAAFRELPELLAPGDLVVVNVSATLAAAVAGERADGSSVRVHFATRAPDLDERWRVVELRSADGARPGAGPSR